MVTHHSGEPPGMHWQCLKGGNNDVPTNLPSRVENGNRERKEGEPCHGHLFNLPERRGVATSDQRPARWQVAVSVTLDAKILKNPAICRPFPRCPMVFPGRLPPGFPFRNHARLARLGSVRGAGSLLGLGNRRSLRRQDHFWLRSLGCVWSLLPIALNHDTITLHYIALSCITLHKIALHGI